MLPSPLQFPADALHSTARIALSDFASAAGAEALADASHGDGGLDGSRDPIDRFPAWLAGGIVVGVSGVFWVGLVTIVARLL